jgi:hypothetical protein
VHEYGIAEAMLFNQFNAIGIDSQVFRCLIQGVSRIDAEAPGFRRLSESNIEVRVYDRLEIKLKMVLGAVTESIVVSGFASQFAAAGPTGS